MVARSSPKSAQTVGYQQTLPLSYKENAHLPVILGETTTTRTEIVTTTHTTTHFFSLPLWKRRQTHNRRQSVYGPHANEHGVVQAEMQMGTLILDKDLPPTPTSEPSSPTSQPLSESLRKLSAEDNTTRPTKKSTGSDRQPFPSPGLSLQFPPTNASPATSALAHAALGIGLPPVVPHASSSNASSTSFMQPPREPRLSIPGIRRVRSSQKLSANKQQTDDAPSDDPRLRRRTRGLSLGHSLFLSLDSKGKRKELEVDVAGDGSLSPKNLTRRSSFWNRKRILDRSPQSASHTATFDHNRPSLPYVPPISPFNFDLTLSQSSDQSVGSQHRRGLSRSFSERTTSQKSSVFSTGESDPRDYLAVPNLAPRSSRKSSRRPETSDAALSRQRTQSIGPAPPSFRDPPQSPSPKAQLNTPHTRPLDPPSSSSRPRSQTNPPPLHRLSLNLLSSSLSSFDPSSALADAGSSMPSPTNSTTGTTESPRPSSQLRRTSEIPKPQMEDESPEVYLSRLIAAVSKPEVAGILAASTDPFYVRALRAHIEQFDFARDPLDVALRRLLMDVGLPRETQQIDRVMEAFAGRYVQSNPDLFNSDDHPYILAFSLIMLHTDAFNKSNKRKMTKSDYVKNTRLPGVPPEVLDCFYDNIVFAPFIFIEDPLDVNGQRGLVAEPTPSRLSTVNPASSSPASSSILGRTSRVDPYFLITNNLLDPLRVDITQYLPLENPFSYEGTAGPWDYTELQRSFAKATIVEVSAADHPRTVAYGSLGGVNSNASSLGSYAGALSDTPVATSDLWTLKVTKVGLLYRKDMFLEGGRRALNRKRRQWGIILTGSQLLMFRDPGWVTSLMAHFEATDGAVCPQASLFKPDELISLKDAVAVFDASYTKYEHNFRVVLADGRQFLLQAPDQQEMNAWLSRINYASAFKTAGVRMRALGMSGEDVELTGFAAATSHLHDLQHKALAINTHTQVREWDRNAPQALMDMLHGEQSNLPRSANRRLTIIGDKRAMGSRSPVSPEIEGADQFKATFDEVKAQLVAGRWGNNVLDYEGSEEGRPNSPKSIHSERSRLPTRSQVIRAKVQELETKINASQSQLNADMRFVRNVGTLTPFQRPTRERLQHALQNVAKNVTQVRLELAKLCCHCDILQSDLEAEVRAWRETKAKALKVATETLQTRLEPPVPRMTLSFHDTGDDTMNDYSSPEMGSPSRRAESSTSGSFHSALDFGPDWLSPEELASAGLFNISQSVEFPSPDRSGSLTGGDSSSNLDHGITSPPRSTRSSSDLAHPAHTNLVRGDHQKFFTADEGPVEMAEDWDKTRCAQRVSLVRLPSGATMTSLYQRHREELPS